MQYVILTACVVFVMGSFFGAWWKIYEIKRLFLQKIIGKKLINRSVFSTLAVKELASFILRQKKSFRHKLLKLVAEDNFEQISKMLSEPLLQAKLRLMLNGRSSLPNSVDSLYLLMFSWQKILQSNYDAAISVLDKVKVDSLNRPQSAMRALIVAKVALLEGDLEAASQEAAMALKFFQKQNMLFEEGVAYFILGSIYRVGQMFDPSEFMFRAALKIFHALEAAKYEAETLGTLGLLMSVEERFAEASSYMQQAEDIFAVLSDGENTNFMISQKAMLLLLQNNFLGASEVAHKSLKSHKSSAGKALASEIIARAAFGIGDWLQALKFANKAAEYYEQDANFSACFESLYLAAETLVQLGRLKKAEETLRHLISLSQKHRSCFHIANAQTLLGIILLRRNEAAQAKAIFNQSLQQELYNDRAFGIAVDYANLAAAEIKCGNLSIARRNIEIALQYAQDVDAKLAAKIKSLLD